VITLNEAIIRWHEKNAGSLIRPAGHALRLLCEVVEVCVAAGASGEEIGAAVGAEIYKQANRGDFHVSEGFNKPAIRAELADVCILTTVLAHYTGSSDMSPDVSHKLVVLEARKWEADADGVLWRPGHLPQLIKRRTEKL
jgi:hypothetical protein